MNQAQTIALYQPVLQAIAFRILKCQADAEDIVQDTFIKWLSAEQEKIQNTKAYLIKAVKNNCLNHLNTLRKKKEEYLDTIDLSKFAGKIKDDFSHLDLEVELNKALAVIHAKLEPLERAVYLLKEVFDFDYKSVQLALDKKQEHCRQLLSRAKKKLSDIEVPKISIDLSSSGSSWMDSVKKACSMDNPSGLVKTLQNDISEPGKNI